jgi:hypothetical protein
MYANSYYFEQEMRGTPTERQATARQSRQALQARLAGRRAAARASRPSSRLLAFSGR